MGKGDRKTQKGKIFSGTFGKRRSRKKKKAKRLKKKFNAKLKTLKNWNTPSSKSGLICYNCGIGLSKESETKEHIPARSLFEGFDEKYKVNRLTVSACKSCNGRYSPTDEEFRNMMGIISQNKANNKITEKSVRSILRKDKKLERLNFNSSGKVSGITFSQGTIEDFHIKNFKGLFMRSYGEKIPNHYSIVVNIDENDWSDATRGILGFFELFDWKVSGHADIFQYKLEPFRIGITNDSKKDLQPSPDEPFYACLMQYNNQHVALVLAFNNEKIKTKSS